ncbi:UNVERIFIED_CONTAM: glycosyltransferase [Actinomycetes bacterium ARC8]|nr:glycosyltransferase [Actinomycetes bacterium ARC8]
MILTAVDDYFSALPWISLSIRIFFRRTKIVIVRYRVSDLLMESSFNWKQKIKSGVISFTENVLRPQTVIFDERIQSAPKRHVLPDPWTGPFGEMDRDRSREVLGWRTADKVILLVGGQDERKGFDVAARALMMIREQVLGVRVVLIGKVAESVVVWLKEVVKTFGHDFTHVTEYLSDEDISVFFSGANIVLLPYHTSFTSTSGVLVRAAASSTPVVASDHGLVGWRTRRHSLGHTFPYPEHEKLTQAIVIALASEFDPTTAREFAKASTKEALSAAFCKVLNA